MIPFRQQIRPVAYEMPRFRPVGITADDVQPHRMGGVQGHNARKVPRRFFERKHQRAGIYDCDAHTIGIGDRPGVEIFCSGQNIH